ncbi:MAG TPA: methyltransferase domain-containing protein [Planctomycetes bacterium]|nr:methyltransferase domain-containing protein [Planctomycetota bacterium]
MTINPYDQIPYPKYAHCESHPRVLEFMATMFGMQPCAINRARVLELGCASGTNLLPMAQEFPDGSFIGIDLSEKQIAAAQSMAAEASLDNVEFVEGSLHDIDDSWGHFDYILCHGVYSWVPAETANEILAVCRRNLTPQGVAMVSYNVYPGWHFRTIVRDMMLYHVRGIEDPNERVKKARGIAHFLTENVPAGSAVHAVLEEQCGLIDKAEDGYLVHDQLELHNHPLYFREFVQHAESAGLQYLSEVNFAAMLASGTPPAVQRAMAGRSLIEVGQYLDFFQNRSFRKSLLCQSEIVIDRSLRSFSLDQFSLVLTGQPEPLDVDLLSSDAARFQMPKGGVSAGTPLLKAIMVCLSEFWPQSTSFDDVYEAVLKKLPDSCRPNKDDGREKVLKLLDTLFRTGFLDASLHPPRVARTPSDKPLASLLARTQARYDSPITTCRHESIQISKLERQVLMQLNGQSDQSAIAESLQRGVSPDDGLPSDEISMQQLVTTTLEKLGQWALLVE